MLRKTVSSGKRSSNCAVERPWGKFSLNMYIMTVSNKPNDEFRAGRDNGSGSRLCRFLVLSGFLALLMFSGCTLTPAVKPVSQDIPLFSPQARWQQLMEEEKNPQALKALARIDLTTSSGRYPLKIAFLLQYPERLRMESLPLFGPPDFYLTIENGELKVFLPQEGKYYIGTPSPVQLASFLPFISPHFQLSDMLALLRGTIPLIRDKDIILKGFQEKEEYRLEVYRGEEKAQVFWLKPISNQLVRAARWGNNGELLYSVRFEAYGSLKKAAGFPARISVTTGPPNPTTLKLSYTDIEILQEIQPELFSLEIPPGIEPLRLNRK